MILKQNFKNHIITSRFTWIITLILLGVWRCVNYDPDFLLIGGLFHLLFTIPALYMHIEYYIRNAGEEIEISYNEVIVRKNDKECKYPISELSKVIVYKPASLDKGGIPFSAIEYYSYARIITKSGDGIIVTCLMTLDVEGAIKQLSGIAYERKKRIAFLFRK